MRLARRALATTVAGLAFAAGSVVVAAPAAATPEDGKGCVGSRSIPDSFVCVISVTPGAVVPTTTVTTVNVTVPELCYFVDCAASTVVGVPVPGVTPSSGVVAVLWYKGQYIPIAVGTVDALGTVYSTINLATATATAAIGTATQTATYAAGVATSAVNGGVGTATQTVTYATGVANGAVNGGVGTATQTATYAAGVANAAAASAVGTATQTVTYATGVVNGGVGTATQTATYAAGVANAAAATAVGIATSTVYGTLTTVDNTVTDTEWKLQQALDNLPTLQELHDALIDYLRETLVEWGVRDLYDAIQYCLEYGCIIDIE